MGNLEGPVLFLDLDLVITGSLDEFFSFGNDDEVIVIPAGEYIRRRSTNPIGDADVSLATNAHEGNHLASLDSRVLPAVGVVEL